MIRRALLPLSLVLLAGCVSPSIPQVEPATGVALPDDYFADARPPSGLDDLWWHGFSDAELDMLVERALERNQTLEATRQRLAAARALVAAEEADFLPRLDGQLGSTFDFDDGGNASGRANPALDGIWTVDLNGRLSAERAAALADADGAAYFLADQRRLVAAAVASQYIELKRTGARLQLLDQSTDLQQQTLRIVTLRYEAGLSSNLDVRRAAGDLARTRAQRGPLLLARARAANALSVLVGDPPEPIPAMGEEIAIPAYERGPGIGLPADIIRRRPDLLVAEADVAVAASVVGIERADLLPALTLPGSLSLGDGTFAGLFSQAIASVGGVLGVPLFDAGRRDAEIAAAERQLEAEIADYRQALLDALTDVESALVAISAAQDRRGELMNAVSESEAAFSQSNALYREGLATLFDVLDVQRQLISGREALIDGDAALSQAHVTLFSAVGAET